MNNDIKEQLASLRHEMMIARTHLISAQDAIADAADACKGTDLESFLNQTWDALGDLRFELGENERCYEKILREAAG